jgi:protein O-mannosyl-transferase
MSITIAGIAEQPKVRADAKPIDESLLIGSILAVTAIVYAAVLRFPFVYDDNGQILQNAEIQAWRYVPQYFKGQVWQYLYPSAPGNYYRPLNLLWFRINDALFGLRPTGWHATTLLLHLVATYLAYVLARRLTHRPLAAAATALLFGVHPMRHGVVAWISGSTESLWAVFFLAAFLAYLRSREGQRLRWIAVSCALYAMALLSKETAIMLPVIVFMHAIIYGAHPADNSADSPAKTQPAGQTLPKAVRVALAYVPVAAAYALARTEALHGFSHTVVNLSWSAWALTIPSVAWFYAKQWLLPLHMAEFYNLQLQSRMNFWHVLAPALALGALAALLWWSSKKLGAREVAFAAVWMSLLLLPAFDLPVFQVGDLVHDRYFYLPSFGAALLLGLALDKLSRGPLVFGVPQKWLLAMLLLLALLSYGTAVASSYWIDDYILFQHAYQSAPANVLVRNNYAVELGRRQRFSEAVPMLKQVLREQPNNWLANYNFARLSYQQRDLPEAEKYYLRAIQIDPTQADSFMQLGLIDLETARTAQAEANMRRAVSLRPTEPNFHFGLGVVLAQNGNCTEARSQFAAALALKSEFALAKRQGDLCHEKENGSPAKSGS